MLHAERGEREKLNEIQCTALWRGEAAFVLTRVVGCLLVEIYMPRQRTCDRNENRVNVLFACLYSLLI